MPLTKSRSKAAFSKNVSTEMKAGKPQKQALAVAYSVARKSPKKKMYAGGETPDHNLPLERDVRNHNQKLHPHAQYYEGGEIGSRREEDSYELPDDSPLMHDEHEDFLTDYDSEDPFNDIPEDQPSDAMHEEVDSQPPENSDGANEPSMLSELMRRKRRLMR
jgi:hypothetical protein